MIYNKFISCQSTEVFNNYLASGEIVDQHVVFIMDTKQIWTHGVFYGGSQLSSDQLSNLNKIITNGDGNSVLTNNGTYKDISSLFSDDVQTKLGVIVLNGDGKKFLSNDGTYKSITTSNYHVEIDHAPTSSDVNYPIGCEARYKNASTGEVTFYKLYDIVNGVATWEDASGGAAISGLVYLTGADYYNSSVNIINEGYVE